MSKNLSHALQIATVILLCITCWMAFDYQFGYLDPSAAEGPRDILTLSCILFALVLSALLVVFLYWTDPLRGELISISEKVRPLLLTGACFFILLLISSAFVHHEHQNEAFSKRVDTKLIAASYANSLFQILQESTYTTKSLAYLVQAGKGQIGDFETIAADLLESTSGITNLQLAPKGIVSQIVPLSGNEKAIGHNLLGDPVRNKEAFAAVESGKLTLAGPFKLIQGGVAIIARQPVFIESHQQPRKFWGFTSALMLLDFLLEYSSIHQLENKGFAWTLHRTHPSTGLDDVFAGSNVPISGRPAVHSIPVPNGQWFLSVAPTEAWHSQLIDKTLAASLTLCFTLFVYYLSLYPRMLAVQLAVKTKDLSAKRELLERTQMISKTGSWEHDLFSKRVTWSAETYQILGAGKGPPLEPQEIIKRTHPDFQARLRQAWQGILFGHAYQLEFPFLTPSGYIWIKDTAYPERDAQGRVNKVVGACQNIDALKQAHKQIVASEERLELALSGAGLGLWDFNLQTGKTRHNERWFEMLGYSSSELETSLELWKELTHPDDLAHALQKLNDHLSGKTCVYQADIRMRTRSGAWKWIQATGKAFEWDANGKAIRALGTHQDIDARKAIELELKTFSLAIEYSPVATVITSLEPKIIYVNPQFTELTGYIPEEVMGQNPRVFQSGLTSEETYETLWNTINAKQVWSGELWNKTKNGEMVLERISIAPLINDYDEITHFVAVKQDITQQRLMEDTIWKQANFDLLTGLSNRSHFSERCQLAIARAERKHEHVLILYMDLDNFKPVNDQYGHSAGDEVLKSFSERLRASIRASDTAARIGGDEFAVVIDDLPEGQAVEEIIHTLHVSLANKPYLLSGVTQDGSRVEVLVGASIGFALYPDHGKTLEKLLSHADSGMYKDKEKNRLARPSDNVIA